jgi:hypothetical protein
VSVERWSLGLDAWIVQDGNYPDLESGQQAEFAVEFYFPEPLELIEGGIPSARWISGTSYEISARVTAIIDRAWVLDCGIGIYRDDSPPSGVGVGDMVRGTVDLGVDPFFYFERLYATPGLPPLVYSWRIDEISRQTAPFINTGHEFVRDPTKLGWSPVRRTNAWHDDDGMATYKLDCELLNVPAKRSTTTAT